MSVKIGERFRPHPDLKRLYHVYLLVAAVVVFVVISPIILAGILFFPIVSALLFLSFLLAVGATALWISKYYSSISYLFTENEIVIEKGVWWRRKSTVPYNRITNIDVVQGPISRRFGLGNVKIQTAGYSGGGGAVAEASIFGVKNFEEIKNFLTNLMKGRRPVAVEAEPETLSQEETLREILAELKKIREILEKQTT